MTNPFDVTAATYLRTRILIIDDHVLFSEALARMLSREDGIEIVGQAGTIQEGLECIAREDVDVVLLDLDLGSERGVDWYVEARKRRFDGRVLIVTGALNVGEAADLLADGAAGILLKTGCAESLVRGIRQIMSGASWIDPAYMRCLLSTDLRRRRNPLTSNQAAVLRGVLEGLTNKEIGARLEKSETAVKRAIQQLFQKTGTRNRAQLVKYAICQDPGPRLAAGHAPYRA